MERLRLLATLEVLLLVCRIKADVNGIMMIIFEEMGLSLAQKLKLEAIASVGPREALVSTIRYAGNWKELWGS